MMWEKHFPQSHFTFRWNWIRPTGSAAETQKKKKKKPSAIFSLMLFFFFGNYPGGFEVLIRQCWLIPAVHNLCYYWMITRDKRGREREGKREKKRGRERERTSQCRHKYFTISTLPFFILCSLCPTCTQRWQNDGETATWFTPAANMHVDLLIRNNTRWFMSLDHIWSWSGSHWDWISAGYKDKHTAVY